MLLNFNGDWIGVVAIQCDVMSCNHASESEHVHTLGRWCLYLYSWQLKKKCTWLCFQTTEIFEEKKDEGTVEILEVDNKDGGRKDGNHDSNRKKHKIITWSVCKIVLVGISTECM